MLKEGLEYLAKIIDPDRDPQAIVSDGSNRMFLYRDDIRKYEQLDRFNKRERCVSNIESLAAMTIEEARRAERSNGDWMSAVFHAKGARLFVDDRDTRTVFVYDRALSPQWSILIGAAEKGGDHRSFVRLLQSLRPSITNYQQLILAYKQINFTAGFHVESQPVMEQGQGGMAYSMRLHASGKSADVDLPALVNLKLQYARGSQKYYEIDAEVDISLRESGEKKTVEFSLLLPERPALEEKAVADEVAWYREEVSCLDLLHILEDY